MSFISVHEDDMYVISPSIKKFFSNKFYRNRGSSNYGEDFHGEVYDKKSSSETNTKRWTSSGWLILKESLDFYQLEKDRFSRKVRTRVRAEKMLMAEDHVSW